MVGVVSKNVGVEMRCKDFGVELCDYCNGTGGMCWSEWYYENIRISEEVCAKIKPIIITWINNENKYFGKNRNKYLPVVLNQCYPKYYDWYQKVLVLR